MLESNGSFAARVGTENLEKDAGTLEERKRLLRPGFGAMAEEIGEEEILF